MTPFINFFKPQHSRIEFSIEHEQKKLMLSMYDTPNDPLTEMVTALMDLLHKKKESSFSFHNKPLVTEFLFSQNDEGVELKIVEYPDPQHQQQKKEGKLLLVWKDTLLYMCLLFWRPLRRLDGYRGAFALHWDHPYPPIDKLTALLKENGVQS